MPSLYAVASNDPILAADVNQFKSMLEGASTFTNTFVLASSTGVNFIVRLGDAIGTNKLSITDSAGVEKFSLNSSGNVAVSGTLAVTGLVILPSTASPSFTDAAALQYGSTNKVVTYGDGTNNRSIPYVSTTVALPSLSSELASAGTSFEAARVDHRHAGLLYARGESVIYTSNTTADGDAFMLIPALVSAKYIIRAVIVVTVVSTGGLRVRVVGPSGSSAQGSFVAGGPSAINAPTSLNIATINTDYGANSAGAGTYVVTVTATVVTGSTSGDIGIYTAQNSAATTTQILQASSFITAERVS